MRVEQSAKNSYVKKPDKVEAYILNVIQRFFETNKEEVDSSREAIINEVLRRVKYESVNSIENIIISDTRKYVDDTINQKIEVFMRAMYDELYKIRQSVISKEEFSTDITYTTSIVTMPDTSVVSATRDIVDVYVNGKLNIAYTFETEGVEEYIKKIVFNDLLLEGDKITVKCIIINKPAEV